MSAQLMLDTLGEQKAAAWIEEAVVKVLREDIQDVGAGRMGHSTSQVGDLVVDYITQNC